MWLFVWGVLGEYSSLSPISQLCEVFCFTEIESRINERDITLCLTVVIAIPDCRPPASNLIENSAAS